MTSRHLALAHLALAHLALALLALALLALPACTSTNGPPAKAPSARHIASHGSPTATLLALEKRDHVCWVRVLVATGDGSFEGDIELCPGGIKDASGLIGRSVTTTTARVSARGVACEGNVDCEDAEWIDVIVTITSGAY